MQWLDVAGAPGSGKSTLCDPLWGPHDINFKDAVPPIEWHDFLNEITRLFGLVAKHRSFVAAVRMNRRSVRKMAAVAAMEGDVPYIQTGFVQRGLGFGWRLVDMKADINELRHFFRLMPVSLGVAILRCDPEIVKQRNAAREQVAETAHENRAFMVELMEPAIELAAECLAERDVPIISINTGEATPDDARKQLVDFADNCARNAKTARPCSKIPVLSQPVWW